MEFLYKPVLNIQAFAVLDACIAIPPTVPKKFMEKEPFRAFVSFP